MTEEKKPREKLLRCLFCKKTQHEIRKLVAGPKVFICDECIELCVEIIDESGLAFAKLDHKNMARYIEQQEAIIEAARARIKQVIRETGGDVVPGSKTRH